MDALDGLARTPACTARSIAARTTTSCPTSPIADELPPARLDAAVAALADFSAEVTLRSGARARRAARPHLGAHRRDAPLGERPAGRRPGQPAARRGGQRPSRRRGGRPAGHRPRTAPVGRSPSPRAATGRWSPPRGAGPRATGSRWPISSWPRCTAGQGDRAALVRRWRTSAAPRACTRAGTAAPTAGAAAALLTGCGWTVVPAPEAPVAEHRRWERPLVPDDREPGVEVPQERGFRTPVRWQTTGCHDDPTGPDPVGDGPRQGDAVVWILAGSTGHGRHRLCGRLPAVHAARLRHRHRHGERAARRSHVARRRRPTTCPEARARSCTRSAPALLDRLGGSVAVNLAGVGVRPRSRCGASWRLARDDGARWPAWACCSSPPTRGSGWRPRRWATSSGRSGSGLAGAAAARRDRRLLAGVLFGLAIGCRSSTVLLVVAWLVAERLGDAGRRPPWRATARDRRDRSRLIGVVCFIPSWLDAGSRSGSSTPAEPFAGLRLHAGRWAVKNAAVIGVPAGVVLPGRHPARASVRSPVAGVRRGALLA